MLQGLQLNMAAGTPAPLGLYQLQSYHRLGYENCMVVWATAKLTSPPQL